MNDIRRVAAVAVLLTIGTTARGQAPDGASPFAFFNHQNAPEAAETTGSIQRNPPAGLDPQRASGGGFGMVTQTDGVSIGCLKPELVRLIRGAASHFGAAAVITSGYRPGRRSYHGRCMAADVQIDGVAPGALARWFRAQPGVGGVGTYGHTRSVHVDVAPRQYSWHHGRRKRSAGTALARL